MVGRSEERQFSLRSARYSFWRAKNIVKRSNATRLSTETKDTLQRDVKSVHAV